MSLANSPSGGNSAGTPRSTPPAATAAPRHFEANSENCESASAACEPQAWPKIKRLDSPELPTFPVDALPPVLQNWVAAEAEAIQIPPDVAALLSLATVSSTIAKRVDVELAPDWREPTFAQLTRQRITVLTSSSRLRRRRRRRRDDEVAWDTFS